MKYLYVGNGFKRHELDESGAVCESLLTEISARQASRGGGEAATDPRNTPCEAGAGTGFMELLARNLKRFVPDIVHFDSPDCPNMVGALLAAKNAGAAVIVSLQDAAPGEGGGPSRPRPIQAEWGSSRQNIRRRAGDRIEQYKALRARAVSQGFARLNPVDRYIVSSYDFRSRLTEAGIDPERITVMPVVVMPPAVTIVSKPRRSFALFAGRLTADSGLRTALDAWKFTDTLGLTLVVAGEGPLAAEVRASGHKVVHLSDTGRCWQLDYLMRRASCFLAPSDHGQSHMIARAFANGLPVVAAETRIAAEMIDPGRTGYLFPEADSLFLGAAIRHAYESRDALRVMGYAAAEEFRRYFSPPMLGRQLGEIYRETLETSRGGNQSAAHADGRRYALSAE